VKLSKAAAEHNHALRVRFRLLIGSESPDRLVFIDESRIDVRTRYQLNGWLMKGKHARVSTKFLRGPR